MIYGAETLRAFSIGNFSFTPQEIFEVALRVLNISEEQALNKLKIFSNLSFPSNIDKFNIEILIPKFKATKYILLKRIFK